MSNFHSKWKQFLKEAQQDAKVLRKINISQIRKEMPKFPSEEPREYQDRLEALERGEEYLNPVFPTGLVTWVESLPDRFFPTNGRKRFAKWLADAVYHQEIEVNNNFNSVDNPRQLNTYNNDVRYIVDYLNGAQDIPQNIWRMSFEQVFELSEDWHGTFGGEETALGSYSTKDVVYKFSNGFTMVKVPAEDLDTEGQKMQHCVGGYCDVVQAGRMTVYSLRGPDNEPHATIDVYPADGGYRGTSSGRPYVEQIKGKQNAPPKPKYATLVKQWLATTDFDYLESEDYIYIMSVEEVQQRIGGNTITPDNYKVVALFAEHPGSEIYRYILDLTERTVEEKGGKEFLRRTAYTETENEKGKKVRDSEWFDTVLDALVENSSLELPEIIKVARLGLHNGIGAKFNALVDPEGSVHHDKLRGTSQHGIIAKAVYDDMKEELLNITPDNESDNDSILQALNAISTNSRRARQEIIDYLLQPEVLSNLKKSKDNLRDRTQPHNSAVFGSIFRNYLKFASTDYRALTKKMREYQDNVTDPPKETIKQIFDLQVSELGQELLPTKDGLIINIAELPGRFLSPEIIDYFVEYTESSSGVNPGKITDQIITADNVDVDIKKKLIYNSYMKDGQHTPVRGYRYSGYGKIFSRRIYNNIEKMGPELSQWCLDSGLFDAIFAEKWKLSVTKQTGRLPNMENLEEKHEKELKYSMKKQRKKVQRWIDIDTRKQKEKIQEQIQKYFRKNTMTKDNFYDSIKEQLGINEEKGRSRQRGIYKFYCMISYSLTSEPEKSRGLDDILADLRALPNVTIVTVAIRNQKIGEGRYIAGLSIKFIPSTPGDFNTPENVKARIVKDIKRLANVQSLFKLSSGLIRLE